MREIDWNKVFTYQPPATPETIQKYVAIRSKALELATLILDSTPRCADQSAALRKLRECVMTANASIALEGEV